MNGIFGLFNLDHAPVATEQLVAMQAAMAYWAADGATSWSEAEIGLGCLPLASTPEAMAEHLPLQHAASGLVLTAGARLDNRAVLLQQLESAQGRLAPTITDSEIILQAYLHWGEQCVTHLDGDWYFAIWDPRARKLFLARDQQGNTGLYYYHHPRWIAFASAKKALLALPAVPKAPNLLRVCQVLTAWPGDGVLSGYEHILRLPPAHRMTIAPGAVKIERYWFPEHTTALQLNSDDEYVEAFLEVFTQAVSCRLRSQRPVGVTLSGGLDSGSVTAVAARNLQGHGENLIAFTSVPRSDPSQYVDAHRFGDETQLAQATAIQAGNVEHQFIKSEAITPLAGIQQMLGVHDDPGHAAGNQYWIAALLQAARQRQVGVLLTGQMGNATISWAGGGENFFPLLWRGEVGAFWRAFEKLRQDASLGRLHSVRRFLLRPLLLPLWVAVRQRWRPRRAVWLGYSAIRPDFARSFQLSQQMAAAGYHPGFVSPDPIQQRLLIIQPGQNVLGASWLEKGAAYGLEVRDPTQDRRLIEFCLAVPEDQYQRNGEDRWLIRRAMRGYLPEAVRLNTRRGLQAADLGERVLAQRLEVEAALAQLQRHDLARQILDLPRMAGVLASLQRGLTPQNSADCSAVLLRGLMVGFFLLRF